MALDPRRSLLTLILSTLILAPTIGLAAPPIPSAEDRALSYLAREVPRWSRTNHCFSCHNNGDAARALYTAARLGRAVSAETLADTSGWLVRPEGWDHNGGEGPFSDKRLARVQFASALANAVESGLLRDRGPLEQAAQRIAEDQSPAGFWPFDGDLAIGSAATYGSSLLTLSARETLRITDPARYRAAIDRADRWLLLQPVANTPDASAILIASTLSDRPEGRKPREQCLELFRKGQSPDGGWGPFADSPPEIFDTAAALLALNRLNDPPPEILTMLKRGRTFLIANQNYDGSWTETTRPSGGHSYAQRVSTTGWATLALLEVHKKRSITEKTRKQARKIVGGDSP